jgi:hypothetical protein
MFPYSCNLPNVSQKERDTEREDSFVRKSDYELRLSYDVFSRSTDGVLRSATYL